jgi:hypothetical protein
VALVARRQETKRLDNYTWSFLQKIAVHTFETPVGLKAPNEMKRERERITYNQFTDEKAPTFIWFRLLRTTRCDSPPVWCPAPASWTAHG